MKRIPASLKALASNSLLILILASVTRLLFFLENRTLFADVETARLLELMYHGIHFDIAALIYMNGIYAILVSIPWMAKENRIWQKICKWLYVVMNSLFIIINLCDTVYYPFVDKRTTLGVFSEFKGAGNLPEIFLHEIIGHWYLTLTGLLMIFLLWKLYRNPSSVSIHDRKRYYIQESICFVLTLACCYIGTRSNPGKNDKVISVADADIFIKEHKEASIILNTPFTMIRMSSKQTLAYPEYYKGETKEQMDAVYSPVHYPKEGQGPFQNKNVVILILESFGKEYSGQLNKDLDEGTYKGYTPFLDSLRQESLYFEHSFAHARKSIDGVPAILSSIPKLDLSFLPSSYSINNYDTILNLLHKKGYHTSFFHGAHNGSMGFEAYIRGGQGVDEVFQLDEYGKPDDFDGTWGIWDEPYLQYFAYKLSTFKEPFATSLFTLSSHHPFSVPEQYEGVFPEGPHPFFKCIGYSDNALRKFFDTARKQPWYENTVFVLCADHSNANDSRYPYYANSIGMLEIQMLFYTPDGSLKGRKDQVAQQIDIMPTILSYLNYDEPYVAFGNDLLTTPENETWSINDFFDYQFFYRDYAISWDGRSEKVNYMYNFKEDPLKTRNIIEDEPEMADTMLFRMKSVLAQYKDRMIRNRLRFSEP